MGQYRSAIRDAGCELSTDESALTVVLNARVKGFDELANRVERYIEACSINLGFGLRRIDSTPVTASRRHS